MSCCGHAPKSAPAVTSTCSCQTLPASTGCPHWTPSYPRRRAHCASSCSAEWRSSLLPFPVAGRRRITLATTRWRWPGSSMNRLSWSGRWPIVIWHRSDPRVWRPGRRPARKSPRWVPAPVGPMLNCSDSSGSTKLASAAVTATGRTEHWRDASCWPNWCHRRSGGTAPDCAGPRCTSSTGIAPPPFGRSPRRHASVTGSLKTSNDSGSNSTDG